MDDIMTVSGDLSELHGGIESLRTLYIVHRQIQRARGDISDKSVRYSWKTTHVPTEPTDKFEVNIPKGRHK